MPILKLLAEAKTDELPEKAMLSDFLEAIKILDVDGPSIPKCIQNSDGTPNLANLSTLVWIQAKHEKPDISLEETQARIPFTDRKVLLDVTYEVIYFWSPIDRETLESLKKAEIQNEITEGNVNPT